MSILILIIIGVVCWGIIKLAMKVENKKEAEAFLQKVEAESKARKEQEAQKLEDRKKQSENLYQKYLNSDLTQEIVKYICFDNSVLATPSKIQVRDDSVTATYPNGCIKKYDFIDHQVPKFDTVVDCETYDGKEQFLVKPQLEFAKAINTILANRYNIFDHGIRNLKDYGDLVSVIYTSDYTELILIPINNF